MFKSADGGLDWAETSLPYDSNRWVVAVHPARAGTVYVGKTDVPWGLYVTTDGGATWVARAGPGYDNWVRALQVDTFSSAVFAIGADYQLYHSFDDGATWTLVTIGFTGGGSEWDTFSVDSAHGRMFYLKRRNYVDLTVDAYVSADGGETWNLIGIWPTSASVLADPRDAGVIYLGNLKTADGGLTWSTLRFAPLSLHPASPDVAYAVAAGSSPYSYAIIKSKSGGTCWQPFSPTSPDFGYVYTVAVNASSDLLVGTSSNGGYGRGGLWHVVDTDIVTSPIVDTNPPMLSGSAIPANIWPPDGRSVNVTITAVASDSESCITSITINGSPVSLDSPTLTVSLAATQGAVYHIPITATDAGGNQVNSEVVVSVAR